MLCSGFHWVGVLPLFFSWCFFLLLFILGIIFILELNGRGGALFLKLKSTVLKIVQAENDALKSKDQNKPLSPTALDLQLAFKLWKPVSYLYPEGGRGNPPPSVADLPLLLSLSPPPHAQGRELQITAPSKLHN